MLAALRDGTGDHHAAVERRLGLPDRIRSRGDLAAALAGLLAAWSPLERDLAAADWSGLPLDPRLGGATALLRADLVALGVAPDRPVAGSSGLRFDTLARAVGGRYVLLGSALGGSVIAPEVERRLGLAEGRRPGSSAAAGLAGARLAGLPARAGRAGVVGRGTARRRRGGPADLRRRGRCRARDLRLRDGPGARRTRRAAPPSRSPSPPRRGSGRPGRRRAGARRRPGRGASRRPPSGPGRAGRCGAAP